MEEKSVSSNKKGIKKAMLFAAGLGSRLKPWTDHHPKALAMVNGKSLLQRNIEYLQSHGIDELIVNVHHFAEQVINILDKNSGWGSKVTISDESEEVLETGGGLLKAAPYFSDVSDFVLMNVDILTDLPLGKMISYHLQNTPMATLAVTDRETSRYFLFDNDETLSGWENTKTGEKKIVREGRPLHRKAFSGIHVINTSLFNLVQLQGKFSMVEVYLSLANTNSILNFNHTGSQFLDVGKPESIIVAEKLFK